MTWGAIGGAAVSVVGGALISKGSKGGQQQSSSSNNIDQTQNSDQTQNIDQTQKNNQTQNTNQAQTQQNQIDPRLQQLLYGNGSSGNGGILSQLAAQSGNAQSQDQQGFNTGINSYLGSWGAQGFVGNQQAAQALQNTNNAPHWIEAAEVKGPSQNSIDLRKSFEDKINGNAAENPYLKQAIQGGLDQSTNTFNQQQRLATRNLNENVLTGIKANSIVSGGYGGSRQGIAEGRAIGDFAQGQQEAINQFGQNNTNAAVGAQSQAFNQGQDRSLAALLNLSGQQYSVESQNAAMRQQGSLANQSSDIQNRAQNQAAQATGIGLSSGLLNQAYGYAQNANNADYNRLSQLAGTLNPYAAYGGTNSTNMTGTNNTAGTNNLLGTTKTNGVTKTVGTGDSVASTPYSTNQGANALGGAAAGLGLYNQFMNSNKGNTAVGSNQNYVDNDWLTS